MMPKRELPPRPPQSIYNALIWVTIVILTLIVLVLLAGY